MFFQEAESSVGPSLIPLLAKNPYVILQEALNYPVSSFSSGSKLEIGLGFLRVTLPTCDGLSDVVGRIGRQKE